MYIYIYIRMWTYMYICRERNKEREVDRERERELNAMQLTIALDQLHFLDDMRAFRRLTQGPPYQAPAHAGCVLDASGSWLRFARCVDSVGFAAQLRCPPA